MNLLLSLALLASSAGGSEVSLAITAPQTDMLVGEPVKLTVTWKAGARSVKHVYVEDPEFLAQSLTFVVDDGVSKKTYRELPKGMAEHVSATIDLKAGESVSRNLVLVRGSYALDAEGRPLRAMLFPVKGPYTVQAVYSKAGRQAISNAVNFKVSEPTVAEHDVFEAIRTDAGLIEATGPAAVQAHTRRLLEKHPTSRYLRWTRIKLLEQRAAALENRLDPDTGDPVNLDKEGRARFKAQRYREMAGQLFHDSTWGPFDEEALALVMKYALAAGDEGMAESAKEELFRKHPNSATAREIRAAEAEEDDDDKPLPKPQQ
jgi:hypothetical protein